MDRSNGYEDIAAKFQAVRTAIGARHVGDWARALPRGAEVLDLGCGSGIPITRELVNQGLKVWAIDASPSMVAAFSANFPSAQIACEPVDESNFFGRVFDGVVAWGLMFLLPSDEQRRLIRRAAGILAPEGRLLFTSPAGTEPVVWNDSMTGRESRCLSGTEYREILSAGGLTVIREYEDEGGNHYFDTIKKAVP